MEKLLATFEIELVYRHFPLHPETPDAGLTLEQLFAGRNLDIEAMKQKMAALMAAEGLPYGTRTMTYNSRLAQELAAWAGTQDAATTIHDELFRAYFVDNTNLAKIENLIEIAQQIGLPTDEARGVLVERRFQTNVDADWQRSRELGITGVPTFVMGNNALVGAQPFEQLEALAVASQATQKLN